MSVITQPGDGPYPVFYFGGSEFRPGPFYSTVLSDGKQNKFIKPQTIVVIVLIMLEIELTQVQ